MKENKSLLAFINKIKAKIGKKYLNEIRRRDNNTCQMCGALQKGKIAFHVHHIDGDRRNNVYVNLITLCPQCHGSVSHVEKKLWRVKLILLNVARFKALRALQGSR